MFINNPGHMTKMAAMPYMVKTLQKSSSSEPVGKIVKMPFERKNMQGMGK